MSPKNIDPLLASEINWLREQRRCFAEGRLLIRSCPPETQLRKELEKDSEKRQQVQTAAAAAGNSSSSNSSSKHSPPSPKCGATSMPTSLSHANMIELHESLLEGHLGITKELVSCLSSEKRKMLGCGSDTPDMQQVLLSFFLV